ncbi:hypothetical protein GDO78_011645 [Eleutherodactylus coqui]|uniref:Uncharacterized protein n=1 Tax=Eleutherodactylus coqui TaxID=57060 RepID=A0A8J6F0N8_ELECQ|nr:hypothetical protein GDO78_011645 [Eleutherodactylus coqui]
MCQCCRRISGGNSFKDKECPPTTSPVMLSVNLGITTSDQSRWAIFMCSGFCEIWLLMTDVSLVFSRFFDLNPKQLKLPAYCSLQNMAVM